MSERRWRWWLRETFGWLVGAPALVVIAVLTLCLLPFFGLAWLFREED
ncbi:MAG: hypothetical protein ABFE07_28705 [Armatimonadia bacterium]